MCTMQYTTSTRLSCLRSLDFCLTHHLRDYWVLVIGNWSWLADLFDQAERLHPDTNEVIARVSYVFKEKAWGSLQSFLFFLQRWTSWPRIFPGSIYGPAFCNPDSWLLPRKRQVQNGTRHEGASPISSLVAPFNSLDIEQLVALTDGDTSTIFIDLHWKLNFAHSVFSCFDLFRPGGSET